MANPVNPVNCGCQHSNKNSDGTAFTAAQFQALEVSVDGGTPKALTIPFSTTGQYQWPVTALGALAFGTHNFAVRMASTNGQKSALSSAFSFDLTDVRVPDVPFGLSAS
jgi:hypothetical protein